jgi:hypothetical protein
MFPSYHQSKKTKPHLSELLWLIVSIYFTLGLHTEMGLTSKLFFLPHPQQEANKTGVH